MGRLCAINLEGKIYGCKHCRINLALCDDIVPRSFHCKHGKAYLFKVYQLPDTLFQEVAHEKNQRYKEGKFILERFKVTGHGGALYWVNPKAQVVESDADADDA